MSEYPFCNKRITHNSPSLTDGRNFTRYFNLKSTRLPNNMYLCIVINNAK